MSLSDRYQYYPQMEHYDSLGQQLMPYLMFKSQNNYTSDVVNTDSNGFRLSGVNGLSKLDRLNKLRVQSVSVFTGGSSAFGIGATADKYTISSILSEKMNCEWVNLSGRAYVSTQEFISFLYYRDLLPSIDNIVIFGGVNDLYIYFASKYYNKQLGSFFSASNFFKNNRDQRWRTVVIRPIVNKILGVLYGGYDFDNISNSDIFDLLLRKTTVDKIIKNDCQGDTINSHNKKPIEVLDILRRNMANWKVMSDYYNVKVLYVLQPFADWTANHVLTDNERKVFDILDETGGDRWKTLSDNILNLHEWYSMELESLCKDEGIEFYDSNGVLDGDFNEDVFVDRIHLTDFANQKISNFIMDKLWN